MTVARPRPGHDRHGRVWRARFGEHGAQPGDRAHRSRARLRARRRTSSRRRSTQAQQGGRAPPLPRPRLRVVGCAHHRHDRDGPARARAQPHLRRRAGSPDACRSTGARFLLAVSVGALLTACAFGLLAFGRTSEPLDRQLVLGAALRTSRRWPLGLGAGAVAGIALLFRLCPRRRQPALSWLAFGAAVAVVLWGIVTVGLGVVLRAQLVVRRDLRTAGRHGGAAALGPALVDRRVPAAPPSPRSSRRSERQPRRPRTRRRSPSPSRRAAAPPTGGSARRLRSA